MRISASVTAFIAGRRDLLVRLEQFAETPEYSHLAAVVAPLAVGDLEKLQLQRGALMRISASVTAFIAGRRDLLVRLEQFAETPEYSHLAAVVAPLAVGDLETWLAEWLIEPAFSLRELPLDVVARPGGLELVELQLMRMVSCVTA